MINWTNKSPRPLCLALLLMTTVGVSACGKGGGEDKPAMADKKKGQAVPVLTAKAKTADMPVDLRAIGVVESPQSSPVRAQVGGTLDGIRFREGDFVQAGQLLFVVDQTPFKAALTQLRANLARDEAQIKSAEAQNRSAEAQLQNAEVMAKRYEQLVQKDFVTREQYEQRATNLAAAQASLEASQATMQASRATAEATKAAIDLAAIQLGYTEVRSPLSGQTGTLQAKPGDLIKANDSTPLVTINQLTPILVRFTATEERVPEILKYRAQETMLVRVTPPGGGEPQAGPLVFVDNAVDPATATIALKAELPNREHTLWPGQFVDVTMTIYTLKSVLVIPASAVLTGQQGAYVFVVNSEGMADVRPVKTGITAGEETVIATGLAAGETVVTDGQLRLTSGAKVIEKTGLSVGQGLEAGTGERQTGPGPGTAPDKAPAAQQAAPATRAKTP